MKAMGLERYDIIPKWRQKHHSYDESLNEPPKVIADEAADIEREAPTGESEPVERVDVNNSAEVPAFEE